ncbi:unnamed protein product [Ceutorhynchus assimilis]|uniref:Uncharacterized protein n=1 Tax=Ceutorhynchus assimilis TaxID=467358 RepID=A0A9N9MBW7_9CUCU|nr:unnamed protein product [Ceutorhynchus assimilis]
MESSDFSFMDFDLSEVASNGCFPVLNIALENLDLYSFDVNFPDKKRYCLLHYAAEKGNVETTTKLLKLKAFPNVLNAEGRTPLHLACQHKHLVVVKLLLQNKALINARDYRGETPISLAVRNQDLAIIKLLISEGADIASRNNIKATLLHVSAEVGDRGLVEFFISEGFDVNFQTVCGDTPLTLAIKNGNTEVVDTLINSYNCDYNITDHKHCNLIHIAIKHKHVDTCKQLMRLKNIDINAVINSDGACPLHLAAEINCPEIIKLLIENQAEINRKDYDGYTPLHIAATYKNNSKAVETLVKLNASINLITINGDLPLHRAAASGNEKGVMLLYRKEFLTWRNRRGYTPIALAEENGRISVVYLLRNLEGDDNSSHNGFKKRVTFTGIPVPKRERKSILDD